MPFPANRQATFFEREILKQPVGTEAKKSVLIDCTGIDSNTEDGRYVLEKGTLLVWTGTANASKVEPAAASGVDSADVAGILAHNIEFYPPADTEAHDEPAAAFYHNCIFETDQLTNVSGNLAEVKEALFTCRFD